MLAIKKVISLVAQNGGVVILLSENFNYGDSNGVVFAVGFQAVFQNFQK